MVVADANGVMSTQALGIAGSGTLNRLAKFTAAGTVGDSQVFDNGTNVGIGTDSPSDKLAIGNGSESISVRITGNNSGSAGGSAINVGISGTTNLAIGNKSAILGGSYDSTSLVYWGNGGNLSFNNDFDRMIITNVGNVLINTDTDAGFKLDVNGTARATAFFTSSDKRKKDIISQDGDLATYQFKGDDQIHYGYIAQDMQDLYPNQVSTDNDGMLSLNYIEILVKKVHDLETKLKKHGLD
jgi:hypothetical protein